MAFPDISRKRIQVQGKRCHYYNGLQFVRSNAHYPVTKEMDETEGRDTGERFDITAVEDTPVKEVSRSQPCCSSSNSPVTHGCLDYPACTSTPSSVAQTSQDSPYSHLPPFADIPSSPPSATTETWVPTTIPHLPLASTKNSITTLDGHRCFIADYDLIKQLEAFVGLKTLKEQMAMFAKDIFMQWRVGRHGGGGLHMVFTGNPGTGKTTVTVALAEGFLYKLGITKKTEPVVVQRGDLVSKYIGQTTEMTRRKINQSKGGVMLVDEAYRLQQTDSSSRDVGREALEEIMSVMEDGDPIMIFAGYPALSVNPGMKSRIAYTFPFPDFSVEELANIINVEWHSSPP
ncbi:hypothetical protein Bbelb_036190 [Branchiostoma belcheri]|nr:hypothetical protein Bbelb_036190 [Branchiostoma belcheri]